MVWTLSWIPKDLAVSTIRDIILVLTSYNLYQLDRETGNLTDLEDQPLYKNLTVTPNGNFILADSYSFEKVTTSIKQKISIESEIQIDLIKFKNWEKSKLKFTCYDLNWDKNLILTFDC